MGSCRSRGPPNWGNGGGERLILAQYTGWRGATHLRHHRLPPALGGSQPALLTPAHPHLLPKAAQTLPPPLMQVSPVLLSPSSLRWGVRSAPREDEAETVTHPRGGESGCATQLVPESTFQHRSHPIGPHPCPQPHPATPRHRRTPWEPPMERAEAKSSRVVEGVSVHSQALQEGGPESEPSLGWEH